MWWMTGGKMLINPHLEFDCSPLNWTRLAPCLLKSLWFLVCLAHVEALLVDFLILCHKVCKLLSTFVFPVYTIRACRPVHTSTHHIFRTGV